MVINWPFCWVLLFDAKALLVATAGTTLGGVRAVAAVPS